MTCPIVRFALRGRLHNISGCPHRKGNGAPFNNPVELSRIGTSALKPHTSSTLGTSRRAIPRGGSQQQSASARDAAQARPVDSTASARMCNSGAHFRVPICRFGDSSHSFGTSSCNSASVEQTSLRDQFSAPAPNAVRKIPAIVMQACGPTKRRGDVRSARPLARRGRRPLAGRNL